MRIRLVVLFVAALLAAPRLEAQYFGQNKVQYRHLDFKVIQTEHFEVHYYQGMRQAAVDAAYQKFRGLKDFTPEGIVKQVPELNRLLELRKALSALKSPLGNRKDFRERIRELLENEDSRKKLLEELGLSQGAQA